MRAHFGNACWSHAWVNQHSRNKIYYFTVHRSCLWSGRWLQCMWTHTVQIPNPIRKRIMIRNGFRNVIRSFVNRPTIEHAVSHRHWVWLKLSCWSCLISIVNIPLHVWPFFGGYKSTHDTIFMLLIFLMVAQHIFWMASYTDNENQSQKEDWEIILFSCKLTD